MKIALTGTPGIGKTSIANVLHKNGFETIDLTKICMDNNFLLGFDEERDTKIIDVDRLNKFVEGNYQEKNLIFLDGHLSHLLKSVDKVIILRCHPNELKKRLNNKKWGKEKKKENLEAEILDIILCETVDLHKKENIFEIDTTKETIDTVTSMIMEIAKNNFEHMTKYKIGQVDWSEEILSN